MTALALCVITTVLVLTLLVTTVVAVDQDGLADCVITSWDLYVTRLLTITLMSARMEVFVSTLMTRTTTRVLVLCVSLDVTVNLEFDPCDSSPCEQSGTCSKLGLDDFRCDCPKGETLSVFTGISTFGLLYFPLIFIYLI